MTTLSIINMRQSERYHKELESSPRATVMRDLVAIMDALTLEQYDAFVDAGPDDNKAFAQYVAEKRAELAVAPVTTIGQPMTQKQIDATRKQNAEFRASGGTYNDLG